MGQPTQVNWLDTTPDERTMATLAHALQLIGWWIAPLIIAILYAIKAGRGEWADYRVIGKLARKILKMGPMEGCAPTPQM